MSFQEAMLLEDYDPNHSLSLSFNVRKSRRIQKASADIPS